jgi:hypothetical protein
MDAQIPDANPVKVPSPMGPQLTGMHAFVACVPWPDGVLVRVPSDNHPGDRMGLYFARAVDTDELVKQG